MSSRTSYLTFQLRLTVTAGYCGTFQEPELLVWLRASSGNPGKVLVLEPREPLEDSDVGARAFRADEFIVTRERLDALLDLFNSMGFPERRLHIRNSSDPESIWWACGTLEVTKDTVSERLEFGFGSDGVAGPDAAKLTAAFRTLFELAGVRSRWSDLLITFARGGAQDS